MAWWRNVYRVFGKIFSFLVKDSTDKRRAATLRDEAMPRKPGAKTIGRCRNLTITRISLVVIRFCKNFFYFDVAKNFQIYKCAHTLRVKFQ